MEGSQVRSRRCVYTVRVDEVGEKWGEIRRCVYIGSELMKMERSVLLTSNNKRCAYLSSNLYQLEKESGRNEQKIRKERGRGKTYDHHVKRCTLPSSFCSSYWYQEGG